MPTPAKARELAEAAVLAGRALGTGGTAIVYASPSPAWVVKVPHTKGRLSAASRTAIASAWKHEASVGATFRALPSIARTVLTSLPDGTPALLVERGVPVTAETPVTPRDAERLAALERDFEKVRLAGWNTHDLPMLARRADGSFFTADLGAWSKRKRGEVSDVADLLDGAMGFVMEPFSESLSTMREQEETGHPWLAATIARRRRFGLPV